MILFESRKIQGTYIYSILNLNDEYDVVFNIQNSK